MDPKTAIEKLVRSGKNEPAIAKLVKSSQSTINRIRRGKIEPRLSLALAIVKLAEKTR